MQNRVQLHCKIGIHVHRLFAFQNGRGTERNVFLGREETIMDVAKMLAELREEREHIEEAILTLERLARGRGKRRGRPPAWMAEIKRRGRPPGSKNKPKSDKVSAAKAAVNAA